MSSLAPPPIPPAPVSSPEKKPRAQAVAAHAESESLKGLSGFEILGKIFVECERLGVSDIQLRSERYVFVETNKGMERLESLEQLRIGTNT